MQREQGEATAIYFRQPLAPRVNWFFSITPELTDIKTEITLYYDLGMGGSGTLSP